MKNKEYVKKYYPTAKALFRNALPYDKNLTYWVIRADNYNGYIGTGSTPSLAWKNAKEELLNKEE